MSLPAEPIPFRKGRRRLALTVLGMSLALHLAFGLLAGIWVIARRYQTPKEEAPALHSITPKKTLPPQKEQSLRAAAFQSAVEASPYTDRIQSARAGPLSLPSLPRLPAPAPAALSHSFSMGGVISEIGSTGAGSSGTGSMGNGIGTGISFLGIQTNAKRGVLMFDISKTVANAAAKIGMPMERIRDETKLLLQTLGVNTRFGMVEFARNYAFFRPELLPSTSTNQKLAHEWLSQYFGTDGALPRGLPNVVSGSPGFLIALGTVFQMQPDLVFIISDGNMQRGKGVSATIPIAEFEQTLGKLQAGQPSRAKVFFLGVGVHPEAEKDLRKALAVAGGGGSYSNLQR